MDLLIFPLEIVSVSCHKDVIDQSCPPWNQGGKEREQERERKREREREREREMHGGGTNSKLFFCFFAQIRSHFFLEKVISK
jgi:hypothetical protein